MTAKLAVLVPCKDSHLEYNERIELIEKARELVRRLRRKTDISFRIGIGRRAYMMQQSSLFVNWN
mgnify:CR=1 FL=1